MDNHSLFEKHFIEETYISSWMPTRKMEEWVAAMQGAVVIPFQQRLGERYKVTHVDFEEIDSDFLGESVSKVRLELRAQII